MSAQIFKSLRKQNLFCQLTNPGVPTPGRLILEHSSVYPAQISPFGLSPFPISLFSAEIGVPLATFQMRGNWEATPQSAFSVDQIIKFLLAFSLGPIFEAFNYFHFYKDPPVDFLLVCHIPPTVDHLNLSELPINLPLGQNYAMVFASHTGFRVHSQMRITLVIAGPPARKSLAHFSLSCERVAWEDTFPC